MITSLVFIAFIFKSAKPKANVPDEFASFFVEETKTTQLFIAGENRQISVEAVVNYEQYKLLNHPENIKKIEAYLQSAELSPAYIKILIDQLIHGVTSDSACRITLEQCNLQAQALSPRYVYDFDALSLKIFVSPSDLTKINREKGYHSIFSKQNALINWADLNIYSDFDGTNQLTLNNDTKLGLPIGYINLDTQFLSQENEFEVYSALYDVELAGQRLQVGRSRYNLAFNSTDFLINNADFASTALHLGSSNTLLKGNTHSQQSISFIAPQTALVQIYRDERLLLSKTVAKGLNHINYNELPTGAYTIRLLVKAGGTEVINEFREVVNVHDYNLTVGDNDYLFSAGNLATTVYQEQQFPHFNNAFIRAANAYRFNESTLLATALMSNQQDLLLQFGIKKYFNQHYSLSYFNSLAAHGQQYHQLRLSAGAFYLDGQVNQYSEQKQQYNLLGHLYGPQPYHSVGAGWTGKLFNGSAYARYYIHSYQTDNTEKQRQQSLSFGWSRQFNNHQLALNLDFKRGDIDEVNGFLSWSYQFNQHTRLNTATAFNDQNFSHHTSSISHQMNGEQWQNQSTIGGYTDAHDQQFIEFSNAFSANNAKVNADSYLYLNSANQDNFSASLSGSQIITTHSVDLSNQKAKAFVKVTQQEALPLNITVSEDNEFKRNKLITAEHTMLPSSEFEHLQLIADGSAHNTHIKQGELSAFVHPATLHHINIDAFKLVSDLVVLKSPENNLPEWIKCRTESCDIEPVSHDGVYRINYPSTMKVEELTLFTEAGECQLSDSEAQRIYRIVTCK